MGKLDDLKRSARWYQQHARNVASQCGEDGIVAAALKHLPVLDHWCVEFGAWDGRYLSNTFNLVANCGYHVVLIEADRRKYTELCANYPHRDRALIINERVGFNGTNTLDHLLETSQVRADFDFLSIDIDGNDYHVWRALELYRPKLLCIEYNPSIGNTLDFVQVPNPSCNHGSSAAALVRLGKEKGYELIAVTEVNLLFVDMQYFHLFAIPDNALELIRDDSDTAHIFCGYDGTIFLQQGKVAGECTLAWHMGMKLRQNKVQVLPRILRKFKDRYNPVQKCLFWVWLLANDGRNAPATLKRLLKPHLSRLMHRK